MIRCILGGKYREKDEQRVEKETRNKNFFSRHPPPLIHATASKTRKVLMEFCLVVCHRHTWTGEKLNDRQETRRNTTAGYPFSADRLCARDGIYYWKHPNVLGGGVEETPEIFRFDRWQTRKVDLCTRTLRINKGIGPAEDTRTVDDRTGWVVG